jgi:predicted restriction endonuclease
VIILKEFMLKKFDRLKKKYGDISNYEIIQILLEKELKAPGVLQRLRPIKSKVSRSIPKSIKVQVYDGKCNNCGKMHDLEYDHIKKFSHGGTNAADNIQLLCKSCNMRKEIVARQSGFFL